MTKANGMTSILKPSTQQLMTTLTSRAAEALAAFNLFLSESILILDCSTSPGPALPGSARLDEARSILDAASQARKFVLDELTPDNTRITLLLCADAERGRAEQVKGWLLHERHCERVLCCSRDVYAARYAFTMRPFDAQPVYPAEIVADALFLGSAASCNTGALDDLRITHVVSLLERTPAPPADRSWLLCHIPDSESADMGPVMQRALPFITEAIASGGRVLVHCEQGVSRSATVVCAHLMLTSGAAQMSASEALATVRQHRPSARPNAGFMQQLDRREWEANDEAAQVATSGVASSAFATEPTARQLGDWLETRGYTADDVRPEKPSIACPAAGQWLCDDVSFDPSTVRARELKQSLGTVLDGLFTRRECAQIIASAERLGFGVTNFPQRYRGNRRLQVDDTTGALAAQIWGRIQPWVPATITVPKGDDDDDDDDDTGLPAGEWRAVGCNSRFRLSKYFPGDGFAPHSDSIGCLGSGRFTLLTVNAYLNDLSPEQRGRTLFFGSGADDGTGSDVAVDAAGGEAGSAVLFEQGSVRHEGEPLASGLKYLLRTDVVYERVELEGGEQ